MRDVCIEGGEVADAIVLNKKHTVGRQGDVQRSGIPAKACGELAFIDKLTRVREFLQAPTPLHLAGHLFGGWKLHGVARERAQPSARGAIDLIEGKLRHNVADGDDGAVI